MHKLQGNRPFQQKQASNPLPVIWKKACCDMGISVKKGSNFHRKSTRITFNIRSSSVTVGNSLINTPIRRQLGKLIQYALVAQWIEHMIPKPK